MAHCWHFYLAVDWVRDEPARGQGLIIIFDVHIEPGRLMVVVLHPLAHADEACLLIRGLPRSARIHLHDQSSRTCVHLDKAGVELRWLLLEKWC